MKSFEYARAETEADAVLLLSEYDGETAILAGGTDLTALMRQGGVEPGRVVDIKRIESLKGVHQIDDHLLIGALTTLEELAESPLAQKHRSLSDVTGGIRAIQVQQNGTLAGDLCLMPNCWYYRNGYGLLALDGKTSLVAAGDNRYHAILGNEGPAKFVSASRFAPALIAWQAEVRIAGPDPIEEQFVPLADFYLTPQAPGDSPFRLAPGQFITHIRLPLAAQWKSAAYEVLQLQGLDWPLAAAAACLQMHDGIVRQARVVLGHVAPVPWVSETAAAAIVGQRVTEATADRAAERALADATPLSDNGYKVRLARTAVKRSLLQAAGQLVPGHQAMEIA